MINFEQLRKNIGAVSVAKSTGAQQLVGRLLTELEVQQIAGASSSTCDTKWESHSMSGSGVSFTQTGGTFGQDGGSYTMTC